MEKEMGLKTICRIYGMELKTLAIQEMKIAPQTLNTFFSRKKIPEKRIDDLANRIFPNIPREYFQKELTESEIKHVQEIYFTTTDKNDVVARHLREQRENELFYERLNRLLDVTVNDDAWGNKEIVDICLKVFESNDQKLKSLIRIIFFGISFRINKNKPSFYLTPYNHEEDEMFGKYVEFLKDINF